MIYGFRSKDTFRANTRIEFKGFEISIAMDDGNRGGHLTRTAIIVYKDNRDVTASLGLDNVTLDGIVHPTGEDLFKIMQAIMSVGESNQDDKQVHHEDIDELSNWESRHREGVVADNQ